MTEFEQNGAYIVSWDFSRGSDVGVLIVGRQKSGKIEIINAFRGEEAHDIYERLSAVKSKEADYGASGST